LSRHQQKAQQEEVTFQRTEEEANAENLAPAILSYLGDDEEANRAFIEKTAEGYGIDANVLASKVSQYDLSRRKNEMALYQGDIGLYNLAVKQGYKGKITDFLAFQERIKQLGETELSSSPVAQKYGLPTDSPILRAVVGLTSQNQKDAAIAVSLALQAGVPIEVFRKTFMRRADGTPEGPLGTLLDIVATLEPPAIVGAA